MSSHRQVRLPLKAALAAFMILPPIAVLANLRWLKEQPDELAFLVTGLAATVTVAASFVLSILHDRQMDEWHRSAARFSSQWGWTAGACLVALLLAWPPGRDLVVAAVASWADAPHPHPELVLLAFTGGFMAVVISQLLCTALLSMGWAAWMSRQARDPS